MRPWGFFLVLDEGVGFKVKRIVVAPGGCLSLQSHRHRSEHWVVVTGTLVVRVGEDRRLLAPGEAIDVPLGAMHRIENPGTGDAELIEVQFGLYLGEDDFIRYEDIYGRA